MIVLLICTIAAAFANLQNSHGSILALFIGLLAIFIVRTHHETITSMKYRRWDIASIVALTTLALATIAWTLLLSSAQVSDFGIYFRCGMIPHATLSEWTNNCQSTFLSHNDVYWKRSFFYTHLIGLIFGQSYVAMKVSNVFLHCAAAIIWFIGIRRLYGPRIALLSTILLSAYPEYWFTLTLATTDNAVMVCVVTFLVCLPYLNKPSKFSIPVAIFLGSIIFLVQQLRSAGIICVVTLIAWTLFASGSKMTRRNILLAIISIAVYALLNKLFSEIYPTGLPDIFQPLKLLSAVDFNTTQDFSINYNWAEHFWPAIPEFIRVQVAWEKIITEFSNGFIQWPIYLYRKAAVIFSGTGYYGLSSFPYPPGNLDSLAVIAPRMIPFFGSAFPFLGAVIVLLLFCSTIGAARPYREGPVLASIVFVGAYALIVLGTGESQARYSVLISPALALLTATAIFSKDIPCTTERDATVMDTARQISFGVGGIAILFFFLVLVMKILPYQESVSLSASMAKSADSAAFSCDSAGTTLSTTYKQIIVTFRPHSTCALIRLPLPKNSKSLTFFVDGSVFPFPFEMRSKSPFQYEVIAEGRNILSSSLGTDSVKWIKADFGGQSVQILYLLIRRENRDKDDVINASFLQVS